MSVFIKYIKSIFGFRVYVIVLFSGVLLGFRIVVFIFKGFRFCSGFFMGGIFLVGLNFVFDIEVLFFWLMIEFKNENKNKK